MGRNGVCIVAKDNKGKFIKEDFAPELEMERFWNVKRVQFASGANSSHHTRTSFKTGMEIEEMGDEQRGAVGKKWVLKGAVWGPQSVTHFDGLLMVVGMGGVQVDLMYPGWVGQAPPERTEKSVIASSTLHPVAGGAVPGSSPCGVIGWPVPLDILTELAIFAEDLEIGICTHTDQATYRDIKFCLQLLYGWAPADFRDVLAGLQQQG